MIHAQSNLLLQSRKIIFIVGSLSKNFTSMEKDTKINEADFAVRQKMSPKNEAKNFFMENCTLNSDPFEIFPASLMF